MKPATALTHWGFLLTGVITTMLGPLLPTLSARWSLTDAHAGYFFAAQFLGALVSTLPCGHFCARAGSLQTMAAGFVCMAAGVLALAASGWWWGLAASAVWGMGIGLVVPSANLLVAAMRAGHGEKSSTAALNLLNMVWGVGAVSAPILVATVLRWARLETASYGFAALLAATALLIWLNREEKGIRPPPEREAGIPAASALHGGSLETSHPTQRSASVSHWNGPLPAQRRSILGLTAALLFLYVGVENGIAGWMPSYVMRAFGLAESPWAVAQFLFWGSILAGRLLAPVLLKKVTAHRLIVWGLLVSFGAVTAILLSIRLPLVLIGAAATGAGLAPIYPTAVAIFSSNSGSSPPPKAGLVFAAGALGGAIVPWVVGAVSTGIHDLRAGMLLPLACIAVMVVVQFRIGKRVCA